MPQKREKLAANDAGVYRKGKNRALDILGAASRLLVENGYHKLSMRSVASAAGMSLGNLQHYYSTKEELVTQMITHAIDGYIQYFEDIRSKAETPDEEFADLVGLVMRDLNNRETTVFFPEIWSIANHEPRFNAALDALYTSWRAILGRAIAQVNPDLEPAQVTRLALFVSSSIEGHTPFIGFGKPWSRETDALVAMAVQSFLWLIREGKVPNDPINPPVH